MNADTTKSLLCKQVFVKYSILTINFCYLYYNLLIFIILIIYKNYFFNKLLELISTGASMILTPPTGVSTNT